MTFLESPEELSLLHCMSWDMARVRSHSHQAPSIRWVPEGPYSDSDLTSLLVSIFMPMTMSLSIPTLIPMPILMSVHG